MSGRFDILDTPLDGLKVIQRKSMGDHRGFLERMFCMEDLAPVLSGRGIHQINRTLTVEKGTIRGLHFQRPPYSEMKFVSCLEGEVFDVAVDIRIGSPTFLQWHGEILSASNGRTLAIPEGFAHGFQTLAADCVMLYFHTAPFNVAAEDGLNMRDPRLDIAWPLKAGNLSKRDDSLPMTTSDFTGVAV